MITLKVDASQLIAYFKGLQADIASIPNKQITLNVINTAKDIGKPSSTGLFYFPLVDKGRGVIVANKERQYITKRGITKTVVGLAYKRDPVTWVFVRSVKASTPLRISDRADQLAEAAWPGLIADVLAKNPGVPTAAVIREIIDETKKMLIEAAQQATDERVGKTPKAVGSGQRLRFYNIPAATIAESFEVEEA